MSAPSPVLRRELGLRDLILFSLAGIVGTRWMPAAAHAGPGTVTLWILAALFFMIPSAFAIARLSSRYPEEGGLYIWTKRSFGEWHGFLCFWTYWVGLALFFPSLLMSVASAASYVLGPQWSRFAESRSYVLPVSLLLLWIAVMANLVGLKVAKWLDNIGGVASYVTAAMLALVAALLWQARGSATPMNFWPEWNWERLSFWAQISYAFTGLEMAPVLGGEIRNPERNLPLSAVVAAPVAAFTYIAGTLGLLVILSPEQISPLHGIPQAAAAAGNSLGQRWLGQAATCLILIAALGQVSVIGAVAARLPFAVGTYAYLPRALARVHPRWHTPHVSILGFGIVATLILVAIQVGESVRAAYQLVTGLMMVVGAFLPFIYVFLSAWKCGCRWSVLSGLSVTAIALGFSLVPTDDVSSVWLYELKILGGTALLLLSGRLVFLKYRPRVEVGETYHSATEPSS